MAEAAEPLPEVVDINTLIKEDAAKYGLNEDHLYKTLNCESDGFKDVAIRGDNGLARGLAQIRSDYHPDITDEEADNPVFAINYMAQQFASGHAAEWSCYSLEKEKDWP